jgi:hypothetical protein
VTHILEVVFTTTQVETSVSLALKLTFKFLKNINKKARNEIYKFLDEKVA